MSLSLFFEDIPDPKDFSDIEEAIQQECVIYRRQKYTGDSVKYTLFKKTENSFRVPLGLWSLFYNKFPRYKYPLVSFEKCSIVLHNSATDEKKRDQDVVVAKALDILRKKHTCFLALHTGYGKTTCGIYFIHELKLKTMILCHLTEVNKQWIQSIEKWTDAKVQHVKGSKLDPKADVYVMGIRKASSFKMSDFVDIGFVIVDEAHISTTKCFTDTLLKFRCKYLLGLSATPTREDGLHCLFKPYFGPRKEYILRHEVKNFTVVKYSTPFVPTVEYNFYLGETHVDWTKLISSLAMNKERQLLICDIVRRHPDRTIMILSDRVQLCDDLYEMLIDSGETVDRLYGTIKDISINELKRRCKAKGVKGYSKMKKDELKNALGMPKARFSGRVLIAGTKKAGVGFDDPRLNMLILATDAKNVAQFEGRIRKSNNIIYDIVDKYNTLERHWGMRKKWWIKRGATIVYEGVQKSDVDDKGDKDDKGDEPKLPPMKRRVG